MYIFNFKQTHISIIIVEKWKGFDAPPIIKCRPQIEVNDNLCGIRSQGITVEAKERLNIKMDGNEEPSIIQKDDLSVGSQSTAPIKDSNSALPPLTQTNYEKDVIHLSKTKKVQKIRNNLTPVTNEPKQMDSMMENYIPHSNNSLVPDRSNIAKLLKKQEKLKKKMLKKKIKDRSKHRVRGEFKSVQNLDTDEMSNKAKHRMQNVDDLMVHNFLNSSLKNTNLIQVSKMEFDIHEKEIKNDAKACKISDVKKLNVFKKISKSRSIQNNPQSFMNLSEPLLYNEASEENSHIINLPKGTTITPAVVLTDKPTSKEVKNECINSKISKLNGNSENKFCDIKTYQFQNNTGKKKRGRKPGTKNGMKRSTIKSADYIPKVIASSSTDYIKQMESNINSVYHDFISDDQSNPMNSCFEYGMFSNDKLIRKGMKKCKTFEHLSTNLGKAKSKHEEESPIFDHSTTISGSKLGDINLNSSSYAMLPLFTFPSAPGLIPNCNTLPADDFSKVNQDKDNESIISQFIKYNKMNEAKKGPENRKGMNEGKTINEHF